MLNQKQRPGWFRIITLAALAIVLTWLVITKSLVAYFAETSPQTVLAIAPNEARALIGLANIAMKQKLNNRLNTADRTKIDGSSTMPASASGKQIKAWALGALVHEPLNARALRILGQLAEENQDQEKAERLMNAAVRLSKREGAAVYWLITKSIASQDYPKALYLTDILLRSHPNLDRLSIRILLQIAQSKFGQSRVEELLAAGPPWRERFFLGLRKAGVRDLRIPFGLVFKLKASRTPPTTREVRYFIGFLTSNKKYELAYYTWLQLLPAEQLARAGLLFNGDFENTPSGLPFDWHLPRKSNATVDIVRRPGKDNNQALSIEFGYGTTSFGTLRQMTMLKAGSYRLQGTYMGRLQGRRGMQWQIHCIVNKQRKLIGKGPVFIGTQLKWKSFEFTFMVPDTNCRAQFVRLVHDARTVSERLASGHIWYDDLKISRMQ